jgi:enoyl-CoA hydratase/carnithine racemase
MQFGPVVHSRQDMDVRGITIRTLSTALIELNKHASFNMIDHDLAADINFALDIVCCRASMPSNVDGTGSPSLVLHGAGPHFCPGGNTRPVASTTCTATRSHMCGSYMTSLAHMRIRETRYPIVASAHGFVVGGGVAFLLNTDIKVAHSSTTFSYGNMSRGHVLIMLLSKTLPGSMGLAGSQGLYLTGSVICAEFALH